MKLVPIKFQRVFEKGDFVSNYPISKEDEEFFRVIGQDNDQQVLCENIAGTQLVTIPEQDLVFVPEHLAVPKEPDCTWNEYVEECDSTETALRLKHLYQNGSV